MKTRNIIILFLSLLSPASPVFGLYEILSPIPGEICYTGNVLDIAWNVTGISPLDSATSNLSSTEPSIKTAASKTTKSTTITTGTTSLNSSAPSPTDSGFFIIHLFNAEVQNTTTFPSFKTIGSGIPIDQGNFTWRLGTFQGARTYFICLGNATITRISCSSNFSIFYPMTLDPSSGGSTYSGGNTWPNRCYSCDTGFNPASIIGIVVGGLAVIGLVYGVARGLKRKSPPGGGRLGLGLRGVLPSYQRTLEDPPPDYVGQPPSYRSTVSVPRRTPLEGHDITESTLAGMDEWRNRIPVTQSVETNSPSHDVSNASPDVPNEQEV